jgi:mono/diheme cytochrome c family protein
MQFNPRILAGSLILALAAACGPTLYIPTSETINDPVLSLPDLTEGRKIYTEKCGACHNLKKPKKYTSQQWTKILDKMQPKAKISDKQRDLVFLYLTSEK